MGAASRTQKRGGYLTSSLPTVSCSDAWIESGRRVDRSRECILRSDPKARKRSAASFQAGKSPVPAKKKGRLTIFCQVLIISHTFSLLLLVNLGTPGGFSTFRSCSPYPLAEP